LDAVVPLIGNVKQITLGRKRQAARFDEFAGAVTDYTPLTQESAVARKILYSVVKGIGDENRTVGGYGGGIGRLELAVAPTLRTPLAEERTVSGKILDTVVVGIDYVYVAVGAYGNAVRMAKFATAKAVPTPFQNRFSRGSKA
jgi:hypothetical protein